MDATALMSMSYDDLIDLNHKLGIELLLRNRQILTTPAAPVAPAAAAAAGIAATNNGHFLPASDQWTHPPFFQPTANSSPKVTKSIQRIVKVTDICGPNTPYTINGVKTWTLLRADIIKTLGIDSKSYRTYVNVKGRYVKLYFEDTVKSARAYNILRPKFGRVTFLSEAEDKKDEEQEQGDADEEHTT